MTRLAKMVAVVILTAAFAVTGTACEEVHYDMYLGTEAGADFDAPATDDQADAAAGGDAADAGTNDAGTTNDPAASGDSN